MWSVSFMLVLVKVKFTWLDYFATGGLVPLEFFTFDVLEYLLNNVYLSMARLRLKQPTSRK